MALSWYLGARIGKCIFLSKELLEFVLMCIAICMSLRSTSYAQTPAQTGFLSIDCGYTGASYNDSLGITWVADETFITTGKTANQSYVNSDFGESGQVSQSYREFPDYQSKYCYKLTTTLSVRYLIRANFYLNGSVFNQRRPFQFSMFLNANNLSTITSGEDSPSDFHVTEEAIFYSQGDMTYFCLQPMLGVPFISFLELRPLEADMYSYSSQYLQYLVLLSRLNLGANSTTSVRFPDDKFDRIWQTPPASTVDLFPIISTATPPDNISRADVYYVPPKVMQDGWLMSGSAANYHALVFGPTSEFAYTGDQVYMLPREYAFAVLYTEYLDISDLQTYKADIHLGNYDLGPIDFSHTANMQAVPNIVLSSSSLTVRFNDLDIPMGPTLNAMEIYAQANFNFSQTNPQDVDAIEALKKSLSLTEWQGDPCTPVPHDWLSCEYIDSFSTTLDNCGSKAILGDCQGPVSFIFNGTHRVTALNIFKLEHNDLSLFTKASASASDIWLPGLTQMRITRSGVDAQTFQRLVSNFLYYLPLFTSLDLRENNISSMPEASDWGRIQLISLNLARNALNESTLRSFMNLTFASGLQELDLSYNEMRFLPTTWINASTSLVSLDLSNNVLQGKISDLDDLIAMNNMSLKSISVSYNRLTGPFNGSLYFSSLPNLTNAWFDNNLIEGTLDLTAWYNVLQNPSENSSTFVDTLPLFSFVNNSIYDILPSADMFERVMSTWMHNQTFAQKGILLGGNPYCNGAKTYIHRYFCRSLGDDYVPVDDKHTKDITTIIIFSGVGAFIVLIAIATLWKLWKQVYELREIQQALANRKVQPPFYQYTELKFATKDFHNDSKLGQGSFGVVYKGVLADKTTLAVKKLINTKRLQELDEFLNEVVLITGIKHKNLVQLKGCCIKDKQRMLIYEHVENGNLAEALWGSKVYGGLNWEQRFKICVEIARGLCYLHEELQPSIIHRDIKPENILLDRNFKPKIADFGLARQFEEPNEAHYTKVAGTLGYFSPEYACEGQLSNKADVYSYGILVLEAVSGRKCIDHSLPFEEKYLKDWVWKMHKKGLAFDILQPELRDNCDESQVIRAINIGLLCVQHDPERRPSMSTVVIMFLGSADVEVFLDESDGAHSALNTLLLTINDELENPTLNSIVEEDSDTFHQIDFSSESSSSNPSSSRKSPRIELSTIQG